MRRWGQVSWASLAPVAPGSTSVSARRCCWTRASCGLRQAPTAWEVPGTAQPVRPCQSPQGEPPSPHQRVTTLRSCQETWGGGHLLLGTGSWTSVLKALENPGQFLLRGAVTSLCTCLCPVSGRTAARDTASGHCLVSVSPSLPGPS